MRIDTGGGLHILASPDPQRSLLVYSDNGSRRTPQLKAELVEAVETLVRKTVQLVRIIHLTGELERLPVGGTYEPESTGRDTFIIRLPDGGYGIHIDGVQEDDIETASDTARCAHGLPGSLYDKVTDTLEAENVTGVDNLAGVSFKTEAGVFPATPTTKRSSTDETLHQPLASRTSYGPWK